MSLGLEELSAFAAKSGVGGIYAYLEAFDEW
jgi:hypothetical protein